MPAPDAPDAPALIPADFPCLRCGYSLKGLAHSALCPECATPVERSLLGDLFRFSDPPYVRTLHRGVLLIVASIVAAILSVAAALFLAQGAAAPRSLILLTLAPLLLVACGLLSLVGWWLLTAPDPRRLGRDTDSISRRVLRTLVIAQLVFTLAGFALALAQMSPGYGGASPAWGGFLSALGSLNSLAVLIVGAVHLRSLTLRIPDTRARRGATTLLWIFPIAVLASAGGAIASPFGAGANRGGGLALGLSCAGGLLLIACGLSYISLLERVRIGLKRIVREQRSPSVTP